MAQVDVAEVLTREHHEIDAGIESFTQDRADGRLDPEPILQAFAALRRHIYLEEELLFPAVQRAGLMMPIMVMNREHGEIWNGMDAIESALGADQDPASARELCEQLLAVLESHNLKEEPIVYPHAATDLSEKEDRILSDFIESGSMPVGWVCQAVR